MAEPIITRDGKDYISLTACIKRFNLKDSKLRTMAKEKTLEVIYEGRYYFNYEQMKEYCKKLVTSLKGENMVNYRKKE